MTRDEIGLALDWAAAEGWNPGLFDADPYQAADPEGFLIGRIADEPVAMISAVRHGEDFGFLGFYLVRPDRRGQGHGWAIWQAAMERLAGRNIALDGVLAQQENYRRSGFQFAYRHVRYQGQGHPAPAPVPTAGRLVPLDTWPFADLAAYDRAFFPTERDAFLRRWIAQPRTLALGLIQKDRLVGYGVRRACRQGHKIGPLFADTPSAAETLFSALSAQLPAGDPIYLDVPEPNPAAVALAERHGLTPVFETARMYTGPIPDLALERTHGVTSFELG
ncbi:GNAT family N-acetyltransferase [Thiocystis violacea]|nr:GNAT family N-acetyltransferase [Thiocystis violacea]